MLCSPRSIARPSRPARMRTRRSNGLKRASPELVVMTPDVNFARLKANNERPPKSLRHLDEAVREALAQAHASPRLKGEPEIVPSKEAKSRVIWPLRIEQWKKNPVDASPTTRGSTRQNADV